MRANLEPDQWDSITNGTVTSPDGRVFTRRSTRAARGKLEERLTAGCPLVFYY